MNDIKISRDTLAWFWCWNCFDARLLFWWFWIFKKILFWIKLYHIMLYFILTWLMVTDVEVVVFWHGYLSAGVPAASADTRLRRELWCLPSMLWQEISNSVYPSNTGTIACNSTPELWVQKNLHSSWGDMKWFNNFKRLFSLERLFGRPVAAGCAVLSYGIFRCSRKAAGDLHLQ